MTFAAPLFLTGLGLLLPVLIAFLVRRRKRVRRVSSTLLWRRVAIARAPTRRIRMLARLLALLACLGGVAALAAGAARPASTSRGEAIAIVVDVSASMAAGGTDAPLRRARATVERLLAGRGQSDRWAIVAAGSEPRRLAGPTADGAALDEGLDRLAVERGGSDLGGALDLAASLVGGDPTGRIILLHDGGESAGDPAGDVRGVPLYVQRFDPAVTDNLGLAVLASRAPRDAAHDDEREVLATVATSSARPRVARLIVHADGHPIARRRLEVPARGEAEARVRLRVTAHRLSATVEAADGVADAIDLDDDASIPWRPALPTRALLVGGEDAAAFFAGAALRAAGVREIVRTAPDAARARLRPGTVVVVLGEAPAHRLDAPTLFLGTTAGEVPVRSLRVLDHGQTQLRSIDRRDAVTRGVDLDGVTIERAVAFDPPDGDGARALVELDGGTVVAAGGAGRGAWVFLGIDPLESDLVLRVAFPVLVSSSLSVLAGAATVEVATTVPRSEVSMRTAAVPGAIPAPEPPWRLPLGPAAILAAVAALLLTAEGWAFRRGLVS